ncbi:MAG: PTS glucose transporter subunit IIA [Tissierellia bacterium]|nr:PTS glucose transporter subunit IIA [Tissierellia bacterium]
MFDFLKKNKKSVEKTLEIKNPIDGKVIRIEEVPDPVFAQKMVGDGFAVEPNSGIVKAPVSGEIVLQPDGLHACGIRTDEGIEVMVHFGTDTVELNGEGFSSEVNIGDYVEVGDVVLTVDIDLIREKVPSLVSPVIVTNPDICTLSEVDINAKQGETAQRATLNE